MNRVSYAALGAVLLAAVLVVPTAGARRQLKPDLRIPPSTLTVTNNTLTGSFLIRNTGKADAGPSRARVAFRRNNHAIAYVSADVPAIPAHQIITVNVNSAVPSFSGGVIHFRACADAQNVVVEANEANNCHYVGSFQP